MAHKDSYQTSYIRQKAVKQEDGISAHALANMESRKIWLDEALKAIMSGEELEVQSFVGKNIRVLFQESTSDIPKFGVIVAVDHPEVVVVTVFNFEEEKFEYMEKQKRWRRIK